MSHLSLPPDMYLVAGFIMGTLGGWLFFRLWRWLLPRTRSRQFWSGLLGNVRGMLASEEASDMFHHYRALLGATLRFAGRNTLAVLVGIAPISAIFLLFEALQPSGSRVSRFDVNPFPSYVSDLDFTLLISATCGSIAAAWWDRRK
jgi:hypothetical protein